MAKTTNKFPLIKIKAFNSSIINSRRGCQFVILNYEKQKVFSVIRKIQLTEVMHAEQGLLNFPLPFYHPRVRSGNIFRSDCVFVLLPLAPEGYVKVMFLSVNTGGIPPVQEWSGKGPLLARGGRK